MATPNLEEKKLPLRVLIDSEKNKVVFAEADGDFVDVLFSFMTLPMGTIVRLLKTHFGPAQEAMGSLNNLYDGLKNLSSACFRTEEAKLMLLNPKNSSEAECQKLKLNIDDSEPTQYFICEDCYPRYSSYISAYNITRCSCGRLMNKETSLTTHNVQAASSQKGVFCNETASFIIRDDLMVTPNMVDSSLQLLNTLGIKDMSALEEKIFNIGLKEITSLLKWSIVSKTPLSDMILGNNIVELEPLVSSASQMTKGTTTKNMNIVVIKAMVQKSTNKVLFAQAKEDFVNFLFSLLTIPLGRVVSLLSANTCLGSIDNLYKSILSLKSGGYLKSEVVISKLLNPGVLQNYNCENQIIDLREQFIDNFLKDPKEGGGFVRGPATFMVGDDLNVTPMSCISAISFLDSLDIPFCDVDELVLNIGKEEALCILRACLSSCSALTNALKLVSKQLPKRED